MIGGVHHKDDFLADPGDFRVNVGFLKVAGQSAVLNVASPFLEDPSDHYGENGRVWRLRALSFNSLFSPCWQQVQVYLYSTSVDKSSQSRKHKIG